MNQKIIILLLAFNLTTVSYAGCGDYLMKKAVIDVKVTEHNGNKKLKIFTEDNYIGRILNKVSLLFNNKLGLEKLKYAIDRLQTSLAKSDRPYFEQFISSFRIKTKVVNGDFSKVKKTGPVVFYANHPLSGGDVFALMSEIEKVRPDVKVVVASFLESIPGLKNEAFVVNVLKGEEAKKYNKKMIEVINSHVREGKALLIFPAGSVSAWTPDNKIYAQDPIWKKGFIKFGEQSDDTTYHPIFVEGEPSEDYLKLREKSVNLSNAYIFKELSNQINSTLSFHLGNGIKLNKLKSFSYSEQISYFRGKLYNLGTNYFHRSKGHEKVINNEYSKEAPLVKKESFYIMKWIDSLLN